MQKRFTQLLLITILFALPHFCLAQAKDRIGLIKQKLDSLASSVPGLNEKVQLTVSNVSIQEYLNAIAKSNNLSMSIDPKLNLRVNNNFNNITASNILIFMAQTYNLDIAAVGSILVVSPYVDPNQFVRPPLREINVKFNQLDNTLSFELNNDSLTSVARRITLVSGKNVVIPVALQGKRVNGFVSAAPFDAALEKLAYTNEIKMVKTNDNFYLFQPLTEGEELYVNGDKSTSVRRAFKPVNSNPGGNINLFSKMVNGQKLISADATNAAIADLVKSASQEMNKSYFIYSDIKGLITTHIADIPYDNFLSSLFQGTEYTYRKENDIYLIGERKLEGLRTNRAIQLKNRSIDTVLAMIPLDWKKGVEVHEFREQNTILLSGSGPQIAEIESFIKQIDLLVPMVLIEVTLMDVHKTRTISTGIRAGISDSVKTGGTVLPGLDFTFGASSINDFLNTVGKATSINLGHVAPSFYVGLSALEANDNINIRSVPKLSTLNGHSATLSIGSKRYYAEKTQNIYPSVTTTQNVITQRFQATEANLAISIKPVVSGDDQVTLTINVEISDFIGTPPADAPPPTSTSKFASIIRAHNEDMIVLGGIERTESSENGSGIPLLSRIPILKWIFSSKTKTNAKVVTVVFIKPTIIR